MVTRGKEGGSVVKIDSDLLGKVEEFISEEGNRLKFVNKKQFVDLAVNEYLSRLKGGKR
ncbi:MAG TPA: hypothetical protein VJH92_03810 [Candidatus Nanoarchaeia archaeon]|nr:hypothetical protein [Candidatus Nanoarchaeia archaeon]